MDQPVKIEVVPFVRATIDGADLLEDVVVVDCEFFGILRFLKKTGNQNKRVKGIKKEFKIGPPNPGIFIDNLLLKMYSREFFYVLGPVPIFLKKNTP